MKSTNNLKPIKDLPIIHVGVTEDGDDETLVLPNGKQINIFGKSKSQLKKIFKDNDIKKIYFNNANEPEGSGSMGGDLESGEHSMEDYFDWLDEIQ